jgi:hypothetical protein
MGLSFDDVRTLVEWHERGACFERVLTLGRQCFSLTRTEFARLGITCPLGYEPGGYFDGFFGAALGAREVTALDRSAFEGAGLQHDLNESFPPSLSAQFDLVVDGGTLEHIFNVPVALASCMRALAVGGRFFGANPANNLLGHGFYQFGPELYFRVFSAENGFELELIELQESLYPSAELAFSRKRYAVNDPAHVGCRVQLVSPRAAILRVIALKVAPRDPFATWPQQSDYVDRWSRTEMDAKRPQDRSTTVRAWVRAVLPRRVRAHVDGWRQLRQASLSNRSFFRRR